MGIPDISNMSIASSTTEGDATPTHSTITGDLSIEDRFLPSPRKETVPWPGRTFIIRHPTSGAQITIVGGRVRLEPHKGDQGGYHWVCVEKMGWLGFKDPIHDTYLGHDGQGNLVAEVKHHRAHEYFCARKHPDGGYVLLTFHPDGLSRVTIAKDGHGLIEKRGDAVAWEFVEV